MFLRLLAAELPLKPDGDGLKKVEIIINADFIKAIIGRSVYTVGTDSSKITIGKKEYSQLELIDDVQSLLLS